MKKIIFLFCISLLTISLFGKEEDILTLTNQLKFKGKVIKIKDCKVKFSAGGKSYWVPAYDIYSIEFANPEDEVYINYINQEQVNKCFSGTNDADLYHGKAGFHVFMGVLFGPFAMIGAAVATPTPHSGKNTMLLSKNQDLFSDPEYLSCYQKKAKIKNVTNVGLGWLGWLILVLVVSASY